MTATRRAAVRETGASRQSWGTLQYDGSVMFEGFQEGLKLGLRDAEKRLDSCASNLGSFCVACFVRCRHFCASGMSSHPRARRFSASRGPYYWPPENPATSLQHAAEGLGSIALRGRRPSARRCWNRNDMLRCNN